jgi:hypothetical protein
VVVIDPDYKILYFNPSFEMNFGFSNQKISKFPTNFNKIITFNNFTLSDFRDSIFYSLEYTSSLGKSGLLQAGMIFKKDFTILYIRDLDFEDRLHSKYKTLIQSLRDNNSKLIKILDQESDDISKRNELFKILEQYHNFFMVKLDSEFQIKFSTSKNLVSQLSLNHSTGNWLKILTAGKADETIKLQKQLNELAISHIEEDFHGIEFERHLGPRLWHVTLYKTSSEHGQIEYYLLMRATSEQVSSPLVLMPSHQQFNDENLVQSLMVAMKEQIINDFVEMNKPQASKLLRNYFWQSVLINLGETPLSDFTKTHIETPELAKELKTLGQKFLKNGLELMAVNQIKKIDPDKDFAKIMDVFIELLLPSKTGIKLKWPKGLKMDEFSICMGCILYFRSLKVISIQKMDLENTKKGLEVNLHFKFPRDPQPIYDFLKKAHLKNFEIASNCLTILV